MVGFVGPCVFFVNITLYAWVSILASKHLNNIHTVLWKGVTFIHPFSSCLSRTGSRWQRGVQQARCPFWHPPLLLNTSMPAGKSAFTMCSCVLGRALYQASNPHKAMCLMLNISRVFLILHKPTHLCTVSLANSVGLLSHPLWVTTQSS